MNLGSIRSQIRNIIIEPQPGLWADAELNQYINDGLSDLTSVARQVKLSEITVPALTPTVALPTDFYEPFDVRWRDAQGNVFVMGMAQGNFVPSQETGNPPFEYAIDEASSLIRLWPVPSGDGTLEFAYFKTLAELAGDSDVPEIPSRWHRLLVLYGAAAAMQKNGDANAAQYFAQYAAGRQAFEHERNLATMRPVSTRNYLDFPVDNSLPLALRDL